MVCFRMVSSQKACLVLTHRHVDDTCTYKYGRSKVIAQHGPIGKHIHLKRKQQTCHQNSGSVKVQNVPSNAGPSPTEPAESDGSGVPGHGGERAVHTAGGHQDVQEASGESRRRSPDQSAGRIFWR